jgi:hypothetical protein
MTYMDEIKIGASKHVYAPGDSMPEIIAICKFLPYFVAHGMVW